MANMVLKTDYKDGQILYGSDLNANNETAMMAVNDNFKRILELEQNKANEVDLDAKADKIYVDEELSKKVNLTEYNQKISDIEDTLELKSDKTYVDNLVNSTTNPINQNITKIIDGTQVVGEAKLAQKIKGIEQADIHNYYGTDYDGIEGFHKLPDSIYAEEVSEGSGIVVDGITILPRDNSISEEKLTEEVRLKLNRQSITDYNFLENLPQINSIELKGNKTLDELNIQPKGDYLTEVPADYVKRNELEPYAKTTEVDAKITKKTEPLATKASVTALTSTVNDNKELAERTYAIVQIGNSFVGTPKKGDILITL